MWPNLSQSGLYVNFVTSLINVCKLASAPQRHKLSLDNYNSLCADFGSTREERTERNFGSTGKERKESLFLFSPPQSTQSLRAG